MTDVSVPTTESPWDRKGRGAFYTPPAIASFLARWAVRTADERVLEPSCGDGVFIAALADRFAALGRTDLKTNLYGVELVAEEARRAHALAPMASIRVGSFFDLEPEELGAVDAVVGNPPYIRYHGWTGDARMASLRRASSLGVELSGLASSWASFTAWAAAFLPPDGGRLGLVLPAELLSTEYAEPVRRFLMDRFSSVIVIAFDDPTFATAQVDAVILLASRDDARGMRVVRLPGPAALATVDIASPFGPMWFSASTDQGVRWTGAVDPGAARVYADLTASARVAPLGAFASVDIGFVSGANDYFVLDDAEVDHFGLPSEVLTRAVERPRDVRGIAIRPEEERWLFRPTSSSTTSDPVRAYLERGVKLGIPGRYKPRNRKEWATVPLPRAKADAFLPYMSQLGPRLITNPSGAVSSNLLHGVAFRDRMVDVRVVAASMLSAATRLSAEIEGRPYGGGVLKLETKEAERLAVPILDRAQARELGAEFDRLDGLLRAGRLKDASAIVDSVLGLDHGAFSQAADVYRNRRLGRGRSRALAR